MIVRHTSGGVLLDAAALFVQFGRRIAIDTIRRRCVPVGKDPETGIQLYDLDAAEEALAGVRPRNPHKRPNARS
jgi:predicted RNA polymerase sigma factor